METTRVLRRAMLGGGSHVLLVLLLLAWSQLLIPTDAQFDLASWTEWSSWSDCLATCGPGIHTRTRECRLDSQAGGSRPMRPCRGVKTQRKACQNKPCPTESQTAHEVACSRYNSRVFSGRRFVWEPFTHPPSPCKLACRARGQHFYANMGGRVQDGTPCGHGNNQAICDTGVCKKTGCDGIIGSAVTRDNCGVCQGDGSSCSTVSGIFTSTSLRRGLNDVISIPEGSTNINITELEPSRNLLLIQTFQGRTILSGGSRSPVAGEVAAAGTVFTYSAKTRFSRKAGIFSPGPTNVGVKLKLLLRGRNPGIMYTFNVRTNDGEDAVEQVSRVSRPLNVPTQDDAIRERMGVSGLDAGPEPVYPHRPIPAHTVSEDLDSVEDSREESIEGPESKDFDSDEDEPDLSREEMDRSEEDGEIEPVDSISESVENDDREESEILSESQDVDGDVDVDVGERGEDSTLDDGLDDDVDDEGDSSEELSMVEEGEERLEYDEDSEEDDDEQASEEDDEDDDEDDDGDSEEDEESRERDAGSDEFDDDEESDEEGDIDDSSVDSRTRHRFSNTQSDERASPDVDEDYRIPKYSQSFSFGERYKSVSGKRVTQQATRQRSHSTVRGSTHRSGKVVSFGLKYVDDENGKTRDHGQTVTVGAGRYAPSRDTPRGTYNRAYVSPSRSESTRGSNRRSYPTATTRYPKPYRRTQLQRGDTRTNSRREELLRHQRQREAAREERRRQERERYNRRVREYQERAQRRQAQLAERRRLQRERQNVPHPQRQGYGTSGQGRSQDTYRRRTSLDRRPSSSYKHTIKERKQSTRGPVIRHYGEDGLYASGQKVRGTESTPDSVEIFRKPKDDVSSSDSGERTESSSPESTQDKSPPQKRIIPRVRAPSDQEKPKLISRVAQPVQETKPALISNVAKPVKQARPDIIPRIRTTGPFENTGGRRPSIISALSGGDTPSQETREVIPISSPVQPRPGPRQPTDREIETGRSSDATAYAWKISGFTECTKTCGGGVQQTVVVCVDTTTQAVVTDENCRYVQRPDLTAVKCNTRMCPAEWSAGAWSACSVTCGGGQRSRSLTCQARVSPTLNLTVDNTSCTNKRQPVDREECGLDPCNSWRVGNWSQCSARCGEGMRTRPVECVSLTGNVLDDDACSSIGKPRTKLDCDSGPCGKGWFYQEWPEECPVECGEGEVTRKIFCSGESDEVLPEERCDPDQRPEVRQKCRSPRPCGGHWFTGPWSKCDTACGPGNRTRAVLCIKSLAGAIFAPVDQENCLASEKPTQAEPCELQPCTAQWYMTSWSQCSKSCGTGYKSRGLKCLNPDHTASEQCPLPGRPKVRDACNTNRCSRLTTNETSGAEPVSGCVDQFVGCRVVKKARLCRYRFYKEKCCKSCAEE